MQANHRCICCQLAVSLTCKHDWCSSLHVCACLAIAELYNTSEQKVRCLACNVRCHAVRHLRRGARAVKYVRTFPPDKQPSLVHAYQRSYAEQPAKLTQQHVRWLREYEAELAGRDLPDAMHCPYGRAKEYVYRTTGGRPAARAFWRSSLLLCCHLSALGHWRACMCGDQSYQSLRSQTHQNVAPAHHRHAKLYCTCLGTLQQWYESIVMSSKVLLLNRQHAKLCCTRAQLQAARCCQSDAFAFPEHCMMREKLYVCRSTTNSRPHRGARRRARAARRRRSPAGASRV